jgi:hypothetical protein
MIDKKAARNIMIGLGLVVLGTILQVIGLMMR